MHERPIKPLIDSLVKLGANIHYLENKGFPPIEIKSKKINQWEIEVTREYK